MCDSTFSGLFTIQGHHSVGTILALKAKFKRLFILSVSGGVHTLNFSFSEFGTKDQAFDDYVARFEGIRIAGEAVFNHVKFFGKVTFKGTKFFGRLWCEKSIFYDHVDFSCSGTEPFFDNEISFERTRFWGREVSVDFKNRQFKDKTNFAYSVFESPPEFDGAAFHHFTDFSNSKFKDKSYRCNSYYRTIKRKMQEALNHPMEAKFHALEMACLRKEPWKLRDWFNIRKWFQWFVSLAYFSTANYGQSYFMPFLWLLSVNAMSWGVYYGYYDSLCKKASLGYLVDQSTRLTFLQLFKPVSSLPSPSNAKINIDLWPFGDLALTIVASAQFIFTIIFVALLILALKRNFGIRG